MERTVEKFVVEKRSTINKRFFKFSSSSSFFSYCCSFFAFLCSIFERDSLSDREREREEEREEEKAPYFILFLSLSACRRPRRPRRLRRRSGSSAAELACASEASFSAGLARQVCHPEICFTLAPGPSDDLAGAQVDNFALGLEQSALLREARGRGRVPRERCGRRCACEEQARREGQEGEKA